MPIFKAKNEKFFERWTPVMAYVLGFFCADGCLFLNPRGSHYLAFYSTDRPIIEKIRNALGAKHRIGFRPIGKRMRQPSYSLQLGSKKMFQTLQRLGIVPNKKKRLVLPDVPEKYLGDFLRGYFDGDGNVWFGTTRKPNRNIPTRTLRTRFVNGNRGFLQALALRIRQSLQTRPVRVSFGGGAFRLEYAIADSRKIYRFMYTGRTNLYLPRKKAIFEKYLGP